MVYYILYTCYLIQHLDRRAFFKLSQQKLQRAAAASGFDCLLQQCKIEQATYVKWPQLLISKETQQLVSRQYEKDFYSKSLLPDQLQNLYIPYRCLGDGNCLYR